MQDTFTVTADVIVHDQLPAHTLSSMSFGKKWLGFPLNQNMHIYTCIVCLSVKRLIAGMNSWIKGPIHSGDTRTPCFYT